MSAADASAALEAALWHVNGISIPEVDGVLALADKYAEAVADERLAGHVTARTRGRQRLTEATNEVRERKH